MTVEEVFRALRRFSSSIVILSFASVLVGLLLFFLLPAANRATVTFFVVGVPSSATDPGSGAEYAQERVSSYASLLSGERVANDASSYLRGSQSPERIANSLSISSEPDSVVISVTSTAPSMDEAMSISTALAQTFPRLIAQLETPSRGSAVPLAEVQVVQPPWPNPVSPLRTAIVYCGLGLVFGLAGACTLALVRDRLDNKVRTESWLAGHTDTPILGGIPYVSQEGGALLTSSTAPASLHEAYRHVRTSLTFTTFEAHSSVLMISSAVENEGKSTAALNLSYVLAAGGSKVLLLEADLRRPTLARRLGLPAEVGLSGVIVGQVPVEMAIQRVKGQLDIVLAGKQPPNPSELLASSRMSSLLSSLRLSYDYVIVDTPPLLPVSDARGIISSVDRIVMVARQGVTTVTQITRARALLDGQVERVCGYILNGTELGGYDSQYSSYLQSVRPNSSATATVDEEASTTTLNSTQLAESAGRAAARHQRGRNHG